MEINQAKSPVVAALWRAAKWLLGILLAGFLTMGSASLLMHGTGTVNLHQLTWFQYWVKLLTVPAVAFGLFVVLACTFVPAHKKRAGLFVVGLSLVFIGLGAYQHVTDDGFLETQYLVRYSGFVVGLVSGFAVAQWLYKGNQWATR